MPVTIDGTNGITSPNLTSSNNASVANTLTVSGGLVQPRVQGSAVTTTSGTTADFTGIPSWVKRITIAFNAISTNATGSALPIVQLGSSGGIETTGYQASAAFAGTANSTGAAQSTAGFPLAASVIAATTISGVMTFVNVSGNIWVGAYAAASNNAAGAYSGGGTKTLAGTLDRIRFTTANGTDAFDAGSVNILYE